MANIRKQFNFRNGVQVDDDNLNVTSTGLVGIGTSIPTESLHINGNAKITGFATCGTVFVETLEATSATIETLNLSTTIGSVVGGGVSIVSGIITGTDSGIVTYFGDGGNLLNLPTSQWIDIDSGFGYTSIYAAGNVGVGTIVPAFTFQVAGNQDISVAGFAGGVGISSDGDVLITGVTTSFKFVGIGSDLTLLNADNISSGTISASRLPVIPSSSLDSNQSLGIVTVTKLDADNIVTDSTLVSSASTFSSGLTVTGNLVATATTAKGLTNTPGIAVTAITATTIAATEIDATEIDATHLDVDTIIANSTLVSLASTFSSGLTVNGSLVATATTAQGLTSDSDVDINDLTVGVATVSTRLVVNTEVGIGTAEPPDKLSVYGGNVKVYNESNASTISIGNSVDGEGHNGELRYGNNIALFDYSTEASFDLINQGYGNFNYYLDVQESAPVGIKTGDFHWFHKTSTELMTLTYDGKLGIGNTQPEERLHVTGISKFSGNATFDQSITVNGTVTASAFSVESFNVTDIVAAGVITASKYNGIVEAQSSNNIIDGIDSDFVKVSQVLAVGSASTSNPVSSGRLIIGDTDNRVFITDSGKIGIGTTSLRTNPDDDNTDAQFTIVALDRTAGLGAVGVGTTALQSLVDFSSVGAARTEIYQLQGSDSAKMRFMLPPKISAVERAGLTTVSGATIYNTTTNKLQVYTGTAWEDLH